ncbi:hypothetical protein SAMN05443246_3520 [Paenibacillus sp. GP183]|nr:hypothetical protein SAMN05443246_3520 [Paenibacillus sp. GP183]
MKIKNAQYWRGFNRKKRAIHDKLTSKRETPAETDQIEI